MKIVYFAAFIGEGNTEEYIARALERAGHEVIRVEDFRNDDAGVVAVLQREQPDVFLFCKLNFRVMGACEEQITRSVALLTEGRKVSKAAFVCWVFDPMGPWYDKKRFAWASAVLPLCDVFAVTDGRTVETMPGTSLVRQGVPDDVRIGTSVVGLECDVLFLGGNYHPERKRMIQMLRDEFGDRFRHVREGVRGPETADLLASAKIIVGPAWPTAPGYWSNRLYLITGYGGFLFAPEIAGMREEGWMPDVHYAPWVWEDGHDPLETLIPQLRAWLAPGKEITRARVARSGQILALSQFRYDDRIRELLRHIRAKTGAT